MTLFERNYIKVQLYIQRCYPVNIGKFLRTHVLENICEQTASAFGKIVSWRPKTLLKTDP